MSFKGRLLFVEADDIGHRVEGITVLSLAELVLRFLRAPSESNVAVGSNGGSGGTPLQM